MQKHDPATDSFNRPPYALRIVIPFLPPTSNHIYVTNKRSGKRFKSSKATAFENKFSSEVVPNYLPWISQMDDVEKVDDLLLDIRIDFFFPRKNLINAGYEKRNRAGQRKAKTRYKKMDTGNRIKLLADCLASAIAVDDSHFWNIQAQKLVAESFGLEPQVHIFITKADPARMGVRGS